MVVMAPSNEDETRQLLYTGHCHKGPAAVRYPRGTGPGVEINEAMTELPIGKGCIRRDGQRVAILAFGSMVEPSLEVAETLGATVADMRFVKPLDTELVERLAESHDLLVTIEENMVAGGAGSGFPSTCTRRGLQWTCCSWGYRIASLTMVSPPNSLPSAAWMGTVSSSRSRSGWHSSTMDASRPFSTPDPRNQPSRGGSSS